MVLMPTRVARMGLSVDIRGAAVRPLYPRATFARRYVPGSKEEIDLAQALAGIPGPHHHPVESGEECKRTRLW